VIAAAGLVGLAMAMQGDGGPPAGSDRPGLAVVGDGTNIWTVVERVGERGVERTLLHHASDMEGAFVREVIRFDEAPVAMAAGQGRLWLVMAPHDASRPRREVYSVRVERHPMTGVHMYLPTSRLELLPSLPGEGSLLGAAAVGDGPLCLLGEVPPWQLDLSGWSAVSAAPAGWALWQWGPGAAVCTCEAPFEAVVIEPGGGRTAVSGELPGPGPWSGVTGVAVPLVLSGREIWDWSSGPPSRVAVLPEVGTRWGVVGYGGQLLCVQADGAGELSARAYDDATGTWTKPIAWTVEPSKATTWVWMVVGTVALATVAGMVIGMGLQRVRVSLKGDPKDGR